MKINAERLRGFLDCMHDEADERDKRSAQIRAIVKAAKEVGYDTKAIRKVFVRERMDEGERQKQDDLLDLYEGALGGKGRALQAIEDGATLDEAAEIGRVHRATVARAKAVAKQASNATLAHNPKTGEITDSRAAEDDDGEQAGRGGATDGRHSVDPPLASKPESEAGLAGEADAPAPITETAPDTSEDRASPGPQDPKPPAFSPEAREKLSSVAAAKPDLYQRITGAFKPLVRDDDDLIIPPFLRRSA